MHPRARANDPTRRRGKIRAECHAVVASAVLAGVASLSAAPDVFAYCRTTIVAAPPDPTRCPEGTPLAWPTACVGLSRGHQLLPADLDDPSWQRLVDTEAARWSDVTCTDASRATFRFVPYPPCARGFGSDRTGRNANTVAFRNRWGDDAIHRPGTLAVTLVTFDNRSGDILDADTDLNLVGPDNRDALPLVQTAPGAMEGHLPTILSHELGHALGHAHSLEPGAVMEATAGIGNTRSALAADDVAATCAAYPSTRAAPCAPEPRNGFACAPGCACRSTPAHDTQRRRLPSLVGALVALTLALGHRVRRRRSSATD